MDHKTNAIQQPKRRRILRYAGAGSLVLVLLWLLFAIVMLPRLREHDGEWPNPVRVVKRWLFPEPELGVIILDPIDVVWDNNQVAGRWLVEAPDGRFAIVDIDLPAPAVPPIVVQLPDDVVPPR